VTGAAHAGYVRFAAQGTSTSLVLYPGNYQLYYRVANWNIPTYSPVTIAVETIDGDEVYTHSFTPTSNVGNSASNSFSGTSLKSFRFDVKEKGRYVISFYTADAPWADLVVGQAALLRKGDVSAIDNVDEDNIASSMQYYNLSGLPVEPLSPGLYIRKTSVPDGNNKCEVLIIK
jgi:hypothetical protein